MDTTALPPPLLMLVDAPLAESSSVSRLFLLLLSGPLPSRFEPVVKSPNCPNPPCPNCGLLSPNPPPPFIAAGNCQISAKLNGAVFPLPFGKEPSFIIAPGSIMPPIGSTRIGNPKTQRRMEECSFKFQLQAREREREREVLVLALVLYCVISLDSGEWCALCCVLYLSLSLSLSLHSHHTVFSTDTHLGCSVRCRYR